MKKRFLISGTGIALGAALFSLTGCGGFGGDSEPTTTAAVDTQESTSTTSEETTTTKEAATTASEAESETSETTTAEEEETTKATEAETDSHKDYALNVKKTADGFSKVSETGYESDDAAYTYSLLQDTTNHDIESRLDREAMNLEDADTGRSGDAYYVKGKTDTGYEVVAYRYVGPGSSVSAYAGIEYLSDKEVSVEDVVKLLSDDYISFE